MECRNGRQNEQEQGYVGAKLQTRVEADGDGNVSTIRRNSTKGVLFSRAVCAMLFVVFAPTAGTALPIAEAFEAIADRLVAEQGPDGAWPGEPEYTGSIVAGLANVYEATPRAEYRTAAELGGRYILDSSGGNFYGDGAYALTLVSDITGDSSYADAARNFYNERDTVAYIRGFTETDPSKAVFYLAQHTVAASKVGATDAGIWRDALIQFLSQVDDDVAYWPVMGLGVATWALAQTGPMDDTRIDLSGLMSGDYWRDVELSDLPGILADHQVVSGEYAGAFYYRFDHAGEEAGADYEASAYTQDTVYGLLGMIAADNADPSLDFATNILAGRRLLTLSVTANGHVREHIRPGGVVRYTFGGEMLQTAIPEPAPPSIGEVAKTVADSLAAEQIKDGVGAGTWPNEADFTGSIVAGMVSAHELTGDSAHRSSAALGADYIIWAAQGNFYGDEAFALTRLSQIATDPCDNPWRTAVSDFCYDVKHSADGTEGYISSFADIDPSTAVFYLANSVVAAFYVEAEDRQIWRHGLINSLSRVDDSSSFPVMALGAATWALAQTGALDETPIAASGQDVAYWNAKTLSDLPGLLMDHQVPDGQPGAGSFYWQFGHANDNHGYTEDTIFATRGLIAISRVSPDPDLESAIAAARTALLDGIGVDGIVSEQLWKDGLSYYLYAGEMLEVLSEMVVPGDLDSDGDVDSDDLTPLITVLVNNFNASDCSRSRWCNGADLDRSGQVDDDDFLIMEDLWLEYAGQEVPGPGE